VREQTKLKVGNVLNFVNEHIDKNGYPPSVREICAALGHKSTSTVHIYLKELEREGKIIKSPSKPRTLRVASKSPGALTLIHPSGTSGASGSPGASGTAGTAPRAQPGVSHKSSAREETVYVPVIGRVTAGKPILAVENIEYTFPVPSFFVNNASVFMLKVEGDSMINAGIFDRDYILVRRQPTAQNGDIVVALIDDEATVKTFYKERNRIRLQPENELYSPIYAINNCTIVGKVIGIFRKL
jgi:repressor LexA